MVSSARVKSELTAVTMYLSTGSEVKYTVSDILQVSLSGSAGIHRKYCQT